MLRSEFAGLRIVKHTREWYEWDPEPQVIYRDRLSTAGNPTDLLQAVWLEPEDWQPAYQQKKPSRPRPIVLANPPSVEFRWDAPKLLGNSWFHEDGPWRLLPGQIYARLTDGDLEHRRFINTVWRIIGKLSTNKTPWHYHAPEGEIRGPYVDNMMWIGYGALNWVRQDPRRCFLYCHRPSDSI